MVTKLTLQAWVQEALHSMGGSGTVVDVTREIWQRHETDLRQSGDLFFTWQYDIRWAAQELRNQGVLVKKEGKRSGTWDLAPNIKRDA